MQQARAYLDKAKQSRAHASASNSEDDRADLLRLAVQWEKLAQVRIDRITREKGEALD